MSFNKEGNETQGDDDLSSKDVFFEEMEKELQDLELYRRKKLAQYKFRSLVSIVASVSALPAALYFYAFIGIEPIFLLLVGFSFSFFIYFWVTDLKRHYVWKFKNKIFPKALKGFGDIEYKDVAKIVTWRLEDSKIFPKHFRCSTQDYFSGRYKGVKVEIQESRFRLSKGLYFNAIVFLFDWGKTKFDGHTILLPKKSKKRDRITKKKSGLEEVKIPNSKFREQYDCYTNDQVEARYLLDPVVIEKIRDLNTKTFLKDYKAAGEENGVFAAFFDKKYLLIMMPDSHDYFEQANINVPATDMKPIEDLRKELGNVLSLIDHLEFVKE